MSTIKAINIQHPSSANTNIVMDANGNMTVAGTVSGGTPMSGLRNRLINGAFDIWQRGTSVSYLGAGTTTGQFLADRWGCVYYQNGRHQRVSVTSPPTGLTARYACRVGSSTTAEGSGGTRMNCDQIIENANCYDLAGKNVTLSFWVRFNSSTFSSVSNSGNSAYGDFYASINYRNSTADAASWTTAITTAPGIDSTYATIQLTNGSFPTTWTKYTVKGVIPSDATNIAVRFALGYLGSTASADTNYYEVTQVQLEEGTVATAFERRPIGMELALCQRYAQVFTGVNNTRFAIGGNSESTLGFPTLFLPCAMRTTPTLSISAASDFKLVNNAGTSWTATSIGVDGGNTTTVTFNVGTASTTSGTVMLCGLTSNAKLILSAEL